MGSVKLHGAIPRDGPAGVRHFRKAYPATIRLFRVRTLLEIVPVRIMIITVCCF